MLIPSRWTRNRMANERDARIGVMCSKGETPNPFFVLSTYDQDS